MNNSLLLGPLLFTVAELKLLSFIISFEHIRVRKLNCMEYNICSSKAMQSTRTYNALPKYNY